MDPRSKGHKSLEVVQDPDGSDNPEATDPWKGCRIQMDPTIQRPQIAVEGAGLEPRSTRLFSLGKVRKARKQSRNKNLHRSQKCDNVIIFEWPGPRVCKANNWSLETQNVLVFRKTVALKHAKTRIASTKNTQAKVKVHPVPG